MQTDLEIRLKELVFSMGGSMIGFANMRALPPEVRQMMPVGVSIAVALDPRVVLGISDGPTRDYEAEYERTNALLDQIAREVVIYLRRRDCAALFTPAVGVELDRQTLSTVLPHKTAATLAGMGWIGKCALLVTEEFGSAVRLTTVLTDAPLPASEPIRQDHCGDCTICTDACPGLAPTGAHWRPGAPREEILNAFACLKTAHGLASARGIKPIICGKCIVECPWTRRYLSRAL